MRENVIVLSWGRALHVRVGDQTCVTCLLPAEALDLPPELLNILYLLLKH